MCVTNTVNRRPKAIALAAAAKASAPTAPVSVGLPIYQYPSVRSASNNTGRAIPRSQHNSENREYAWSSFSSSTTQYEQPQVKPQRPKRKRKPQKPGKTAKMNDRHFVVHNYHDHAKDIPDEFDVQQALAKRRGGISISFPLKLHAMLDQIEADGLGHVISWQPHGRAFLVHNPKEFVAHVMPKYFRQTKLTSFQRQLNLYGFNRLTKGKDNRGYYHELFLRGKPFLCKHMVRTKVKGTGFKAASSPDQEPDFYSMPPVVISPPTSGTSDHDSSSDDGSSNSLDTFFHEKSAHNPMETTEFVTSRAVSPSDMQDSQHQLTKLPEEVTLTLQRPVQIETGDVVLDGVVDELFVENNEECDNDAVADFVQTWGSSGLEEPSSSFDLGEVFEDDLRDDYQLGCVLEKILAD